MSKNYPEKLTIDQYVADLIELGYPCTGNMNPVSNNFAIIIAIATELDKTQKKLELTNQYLKYLLDSKAADLIPKSKV